MRAVTGSSAVMRRGAVRSGAASIVWAALEELIDYAESEAYSLEKAERQPGSRSRGRKGLERLE
jgi:hypothetical protein